MIAMFAMFHMTAQGWILPLAQQKSWNPPILLVASAVVMVVAYVTLRRRGAVEVADRIFLGYVAAIAMAAGVEVAREMFLIVRDHVPQNLGVAMRRTHRPPAGGRSGFGQAGGQERGRGRATRVVVLQWSLGSRAVATRDRDTAQHAAKRTLTHRRALSRQREKVVAFKRSRVRLPSAPLCHSRTWHSYKSATDAS
jgi:hypothetical protein